MNDFKKKFSVDALLVSGSKAQHLHTVYTTHKSMNKKKTTLLVVDNVSDVMQEAVIKLFSLKYSLK